MPTRLNGEPAKFENHVPEAVMAYAAGFIDGEGYIAIRKLKPDSFARRVSPDYGIHIEVTNTNKGVLDFLSSHFGGHVYEYRHWDIKGNGCKLPYIWALYQRQSYDLLTLLLPYLQVKRNHAQICIEFFETRRHKPSQTRLPPEELARSEKYFQAMKVLNKRGAQHGN
jgi:hypothetical protein